MKLRVERFTSNNDATLGVFYIDGKARCFTVEDGHRTKKEYGETRIPAGTYQVKLRQVGGFHQRYTKKFPALHKGMLWLQDVPNFEYVLIHIGNTDDDTAGCLLIGMGAQFNDYGGGQITSSTLAYTKIYPEISQVLIAGGEVEIEIVDRDR